MAGKMIITELDGNAIIFAPDAVSGRLSFMPNLSQKKYW